MTSKTFNANITLLPNGKTQAEFRGKWINFLDDTIWRPIDVALHEEGQNWVCRSGPFTAKLPLLANGEAELVSTNKWDIFSKQRINDVDFAVRFTPIGVSLVPGVVSPLKPSEIVYVGAYPFGDLIYNIQHGRAPRLQKLVRFNQQPQGNQDINLQFYLTYDDDNIHIYDRIPSKKEQDIILDIQQEITYEFSKKDNNLVEIMRKIFEVRNKTKQKWDKQTKVFNDPVSFYSKNILSNRGVGFKKFKVWDSSGKFELIKVKLEHDIAGVTLTKIIPRKFLNNATYPVYTDITSTFYPDPNIETTSVDGWVEETSFSDTWSNIRNSAGDNSDDSSSIIKLGYDTGNALNTFNTIYRMIMLFDTSAIGAGGTVSASTMSLFGNSKSDYNNTLPNINIYGSTPANNTSLSSSDYAQTQNTAFSTAIAYNDYSTSAYNDFTLNADGQSAISVTGISKFSGKNANYDVANSAPAWLLGQSADIQSKSAETAGTTSDPKLVVTYTINTASPSACLMMG